MKTTTFILLCLLVCVCVTSAQNINSDKNLAPVKISNWERRALLFIDVNECFSAAKDSLIQKIGEKEFEMVLNYCHARSWPSAMSPEVGKMDSGKKSKLHDKLDRLKIFRIAEFTPIAYGKPSAYRYSIIKVPYRENKDWDSTQKWETVYFIVRSDTVKETNQN